MMRGPLALGVMVTSVMPANIAARLYRKRGISRVRRALSTRRPRFVCSAALAVLAACAACLGERGGGAFTNRMAQSGTAYLTRAARQPVRWQPWGRDAFALATKLDRPILLYIGGDVCRWCTASDREIYTDPEIGAMINSLFVPVRVDRDERPDVAQRYQAAVEHLAGLNGWPLTVFLTDDGSAFFGGTYFPADDPITGRGLKQLLPEIARRYHDQRSSIVEQAALLQQLVNASGGGSPGVLEPSLVEAGVASVRHEMAEAATRRVTGGSVTYAEAVALLWSADSSARGVARRALDVMLDSAAGGPGGEGGRFAAEDQPRLVQAALVTTLTKAWRVSGDDRYREIARARVRDLSNDLTDGVFIDQESYVLEHLLIAADGLADSSAVRRGLRALDALLQRVYVRGRGVRHLIAGAPTKRPLDPTLGLLQDQVQLAAACLAAYQVRRDSQYLDVAVDLAGVIDRSYADSLGGYFDVSNAIANSAPSPPGDRGKQVLDDVLPGPNAEAALVLARLSILTGDPSYRRRARKTLQAFAGAMRNAGIRSTTFLAAARETLAIP